MLFTQEDKALASYIPLTPTYLPTHSLKPTHANDNISEGYSEQEPWKTQVHDDSAPPNEVSNQVLALSRLDMLF